MEIRRRRNWPAGARIATLIALLAVGAGGVFEAAGDDWADIVVEYLQEQRREAGVAGLERREALDRVARARAEAVAALPHERRLSQRDSLEADLKQAGIGRYRHASIHLDMNRGYEEPADGFMRTWRDYDMAWSKAMDPRFDAVGVATARGSDGWIILVAVFLEELPTRHNLRELELRTIEAVNRVREEHGLSTLVERNVLRKIARGHSRDMIRRGYFAHVSPDGGKLEDRVRAAGLPYRRVSENIGRNRGWDDPVEVAVDSWMKSPGHREAILTPDFSETGVGAATEGRRHDLPDPALPPAAAGRSAPLRGAARTVIAPGDRAGPLRLPRGRCAPSPTGELHLGNASSALLAWLSIRARDGSFVMRMEDLDRNRVRPGLAGRILDDLTWLGIDWDEGPDLGGPFAPYEQWARRDRYRAAFERLRDDGRLYPCFCSRKEIAAAASAPQTPGDEIRYPGSCAGIDPGEALATRARAGSATPGGCACRRTSGPPSSTGCAAPGARTSRRRRATSCVFRSDGVPAYQLAVVVDDAEMGIDEVVRGDDLLPSTARQLLLYRALGWKPPTFGHVPLLLGTDGVRLSKRHRGTTLRELRNAGFGPEQVVGRLAWTVGLRPRPEPVSAADLIDGFALEQVPPAPDGIVIDPSGWPDDRP